MEIKAPDDVLKELKKIYQEHEEIQNKRDEDYEKKKHTLEQLLSELSDQRKKAAEENDRVKAAARDLEIREKTLDDRELKFTKMITEHELLKKELAQLRMERDDLEFERAVRGDDCTSPDMTSYILRSEHDEIVSELKKTIDSLQSERLRLMKNSIGIQDYGRMNGAESAPLTADMLLSHIKEQTDIEMLDSAGQSGNIVIRKDGVLYSFEFTAPPSFEILAESISPLQREQIENGYPELQFTSKEDGVHITGYFTDDIEPGKLLDRVFRIGACLMKEED